MREVGGYRSKLPVCSILVSVPACFRLRSFFRRFVHARKSGPETSSIHAQAHISKTISLALCTHGLRVRDLQRAARHWHMEATASLHAVYMHKRMSIPAVNLLLRASIPAVNLLLRVCRVNGNHTLQ